MPKLEEQFNNQTLSGTVPVNTQNLLQDLVQTLVLDDLNDVNISSPVNGQILGYQSGTNSWQNTNAAIIDGDKGDITTSGGGNTWTIDNNTVTTAKINNNAVTTAKILDSNVTNAKLAQVATATVKGRATAGTGNVEDLVIDADLTSVSALDDTIPSAKATKAYVDILELKTRIRNGGLLNGFILPTVTTNNLTLSISTSASSQVNPTASNPVYVWINNTLRSITSALSVSANAGTNWLNMGSSELATREVDLFAFMQWNTTTSAVNILVSRIPYARLMGDFTNSGTAEKGVFGIINYNATNDVVNVGRFAATLSAGAGHTWSVPTFTNANLIQEPIYETRWLDWSPTYTGSGGMTVALSADNRNRRKYTIKNDMLWIEHSAILIAGGTAGVFITMVLPFTIGTSANQGGRSTFTVANTSNVIGKGSGADTGPANTLEISRYDGANQSLGNFWQQVSGWANLR